MSFSGSIVVEIYYLYIGLYSEGLYRKSPSAAAVKKLKNTIVSSGKSVLCRTCWFITVIPVGPVIIKMFSELSLSQFDL